MREIHSKQVKCLVQKSIHQYFWIRITWALLSVLSGKFVHRKKRTLKFGRWDLNLPTSMNPFALKLRRKVGGFITQHTMYLAESGGTTKVVDFWCFRQQSLWILAVCYNKVRLDFTRIWELCYNKVRLFLQGFANFATTKFAWILHRRTYEVRFSAILTTRWGGTQIFQKSSKYRPLSHTHVLV